MKIILVLAISFHSVFCSAQFVEDFLPKPAQFSCGDGRVYNDHILYGATPSNSANKPVLIYVHGYMDNGYGWFFQKNKMYHKSYLNGYRTAFLGHPRTAGIYQNGLTISGMIEQVADHYNTNEIVVIAHSKGGLDTEMAMIEYDADQYVKAVITLSTPFQGVPISDFYGQPILTPIVNSFPIFGQLLKQQGTANLQPGYLQGVIRPYLDNHPNNRPEKFITLGGKGKTHRPNFPFWVSQDIPNILFYNNPSCWQLPIGNANELLIRSFFTASGFITNALPTNISTHNGNSMNDGLVPYYSSIRPGSYEYLSHTNYKSNLNHGDFLYAGHVWRFIQPILSDLDNILNSQLRVKVSEVRTNYSETYSSDLQIISKENSSFSLENKDVKLLLVSNDDKIALFEGDTKVSSTDIEKTELEMSDKVRMNETLEREVQYHIESKEDYVGVLQNTGQHIVANFKFDQVKTFVWDYFNEEKISIEIPRILQEEMYLEVSAHIDLKGELLDFESIKIPLIEVGANIFELESFPIELSEGLYTATIHAKGNGKSGLLATSFVVRNDKPTSGFSSNEMPRIYPNPVIDKINITNLYGEEDVQVKVFDLSGKLLIEKGLSGQELDLRTLERGVFILEIQQGTNVSRLKIIKQ